MMQEGKCFVSTDAVLTLSQPLQKYIAINTVVGVVAGFFPFHTPSGKAFC